jgi:hypothetical protein
MGNDLDRCTRDDGGEFVQRAVSDDGAELERSLDALPA